MTCCHEFQREERTFVVKRNVEEDASTYIAIKNVNTGVGETRHRGDSKRDKLLFTFGEIQGLQHIFQTNTLDVSKYKFGICVDRIFDIYLGKSTYKPDGYNAEELICVEYGKK